MSLFQRRTGSTSPRVEMYNVSQRGNAVFAFFTTVMFSLLGVIALTSPILLYFAAPYADVSAADVIV